MGFFTDAYDLFCISLVTKLLGRIYYFDSTSATPGSLPPNVSATVNGMAFCGTLSGQPFFGWLGDKMGRKKVYGLTLMLMVICSIASGLSFGHTAKSVVATLCVFRSWLGLGIGGDYPLSTTIKSEYTNKRTHGAFIDATFINHNRFVFDIPDNFGNSPISVIILANNCFRGCLPASLGNMSKTLNEIILLNNLEFQLPRQWASPCTDLKAVA